MRWYFHKAHLSEHHLILDVAAGFTEAQGSGWDVLTITSTRRMLDINPDPGLGVYTGAISFSPFISWKTMVQRLHILGFL